MKPCAVYQLKFPNGKSYIGISTQHEKRWGNHRINAERYGRKSPLYDAIRCYGFDSIEKRVLVIASLEYARNLERDLIQQWETMWPNGYNLMPGGDVSPFALYPELAKKMGETRIGSKASAVTRARMSAAAMGVPKSAEARKSMSAAAKIRANKQSVFRWGALSARLAYAEAIKEDRAVSILKGGV